MCEPISNGLSAESMDWVKDMAGEEIMKEEYDGQMLNVRISNENIWQKSGSDEEHLERVSNANIACKL